jgi:pilus assembly protein Flp/PilA
MSKLISLVKNFSREEEGATAVEYGIMVALIAVAIIATVQLIGVQLNGAFQTVQAALP